MLKRYSFACRRTAVILLAAAAALNACTDSSTDTGLQSASNRSGPPSPRDVHSYSRPDEVRVRHLDLDLAVDFETRTLAGRVSLTIENAGEFDSLHLDTRDLDIHSVTLDTGDAALFELGPIDSLFGQDLTVAITPDTETVHIDYSTHPDAEALQWLTPQQTAGGAHPFVFSQSQAILARTWIPCQDTPGVRTTYDATLRVPPPLLALMSAENPRTKTGDGIYHFEMTLPIPSYLLAIAVGDLEFRDIGQRTGVYAEPNVVESAAWEFAEVESMFSVIEKLYGPYRWGRYDLLVLPPSFPFGGMENPILTFATPTILAGDRSLVSLVAHELAHSWSGNLVTNSTWNDFWLNEGFTSYIEYRTMEELRGPEYAEMLWSLGHQELTQELAAFGPDSPMSHLRLDLEGRNPDDGMTSVSYDKGAAFLRHLERNVGRDRWDEFLTRYFDRYAFQPIDTDTFIEYLESNLLSDENIEKETLHISDWIDGPGIPENYIAPQATGFDPVMREIERWRTGTPSEQLLTDEWSTHHWLYFLRNLPTDIGTEDLAALDSSFEFTASGNSEILSQWLLIAQRGGYRQADLALSEFLTGVGRRKFLEPLYTELIKTPSGREMASAIYEEARPGYHPVVISAIDQLLEQNAPER